MPRIRLTENLIRSTENKSNKPIILADTEIRSLHLFLYEFTKTYRFMKAINGKRHDLKIGSTNDIKLSDARSQAQRLEVEIRSNQRLPQSNMLIKEACERFLVPYYVNFVKDQNPLGIINNFIIPYFGDMEVGKLTPFTIQKVIYELMESGYAAETVRKRVLVGKALYKQLIKHQLVLLNPFNATDLPTVSNIRTVVLTQEQRYSFIQSCIEEESVFSDLILLLLFTGLRVSEATGIKLEDISDGFTTLKLPFTKAGVPQHIVLNSYAQEIVKRRRNLTWNAYLFASPAKSGSHIASPRGALDRIKERMAVKGFDISDLTLHDLRRTFATTCAEVTGDMQMVAHQIRHSSVHILKRYIHRQRNDVIAASEATAQSLMSPIIHIEN